MMVAGAAEKTPESKQWGAFAPVAQLDSSNGLLIRRSQVRILPGVLWLVSVMDDARRSSESQGWVQILDGLLFAGVVQWIERLLAEQNVASSNLAVRTLGL